MESHGGTLSIWTSIYPEELPSGMHLSMGHGIADCLQMRLFQSPFVSPEVRRKFFQNTFDSWLALHVALRVQSRQDAGRRPPKPVPGIQNRVPERGAP